MPASGSDDGASGQAPHVVLLPSAGMGHLVPFGRLAVALSSASHGCDVSVATVLPAVSSAESSHLGALFDACSPAVCCLDFHLAPFDDSEFPGADPFFLRLEAVRRSAPLLGRLLAGARASALVTDIALASVVLRVARELRIPCYVLFTASAAMLSLCAYFPVYLDPGAGRPVGNVDIPGVYRVPKASIPQVLHDPSHLFTRQFVANGSELGKADGVLVNSFDACEPEALAALRAGSVAAGFPLVLSVGPLAPVSFRAGEPANDPASYMEWLEEQPARSVVYVSFGSRKSISRDRGQGRRRRAREGFLERVRGRGVVTKGWVEQEEVLKYEFVGLFVSHCGWSSVTEAAASGVPVLAWPRFGDQRVNAGVVARRGLVPGWSGGAGRGKRGVVAAVEIAEKVKAVMADETARWR